MCMRSNVRWKPMTNSQKCILPRVSLNILPVIFGIPVIDGGEDRKHNPTYHV